MERACRRNKMKTQEIWKAVEEDTQGTIVKRLVYTKSKRRFFCAYDHEKNQPIFIVEFDRSEIPDSVSFPKTKGLSFHHRLFGDEPQEKTSIGMYLNDAQYKDFFHQMVDDLIAFLKYGAKTVTFPLFQQRIVQWVRFLEVNQGRSMNSEQQLGLYGELFFMRQHLFPIKNPKEVIACWSGADAAPKDFSFSSVLYEVKSKVQKNSMVHITSEKQLSRSEAPLYLIVQQFARRNTEPGHSLLTIIEEIRDWIDREKDAASTRSLFDHKLLQYGYSDLQSKEYAAVFYQIKETNVYEISDGFPKITTSDLPIGVSRVSYQIDLEQCEPFLKKDFSFLA